MRSPRSTAPTRATPRASSSCSGSRVRSGDRLARALAEGAADPARVAEVSSAVAAQLVEVAADRRGHAERRVDAERARAAAQAELDRLRASGRARRDVRIAVEADAAGELTLELTYVVHGAGWTCAYDARVDVGGDGAGPLALTWYGMITQATGEDWPACELTLSTARPGLAGTVPELEPWWVDVRPPAPPMPVAAAAPAAFRAKEAVQDVQDVTAEAQEGTLAVAWRLPRPTAVPADGTPHRTTVATATLDARLDHVVAPALDPAAHLRATVVNTGGHALLAGPLSAFLDGAFVGTTHIDATAPGAELELHLGVDDRVAVERELLERTPHRALLGGKISAVERWRIEVRNGRPGAGPDRRARAGAGVAAPGRPGRRRRGQARARRARRARPPRMDRVRRAGRHVGGERPLRGATRA